MRQALKGKRFAKNMLKGTFIPPRPAVSVSVWLLSIFLFMLVNSCGGQHYFFEEIKKIKSGIDPAEQDTAWQNHTDEQDPFISFENATLMENDEPKESIVEKIKFPEFYHAQGIISLPFDGIIEPFEAWYAGSLKMSRIDYYYGNQAPNLVIRSVPVTHCFTACCVCPSDCAYSPVFER